MIICWGFSKQVELTSLDPLIPTERLVACCPCPCSILTQQHLAERFEAALVCLDSDWDAIAQQPDENLLSAATPENLVYVVYTSGSTGTPRSRCRASATPQLSTQYSGKTRPERWFQFCNSTTFADLGNTVIFPALCTGGCLHVISQERATNPEALQITAIFLRLSQNCPFSFERSWLLPPGEDSASVPGSGREALSWKLVEKLQQYKPSCRILNHGPTEATVGVSTFTICQSINPRQCH